LPWWLQTVAIVFSAGMFIPVVAGTTNFLMTMRGSWSHISKSYVLPFFLVGVIFYFVGSTQGSLQAFRFTNFVWHFTDFNVAHSHMTMYGIISFILWACIYAIIPKLTGKEPKQIFVGTHFWFAFIGLMVYMISMMVGGTLKGLSWIENEPFIQSVILMYPYWVWRAIGGTLMFLSHLVFAYNFYVMSKNYKTNKVTQKTLSHV
jgi:cytochrome c oxidase cbb3-type subunit 1